MSDDPLHVPADDFDRLQNIITAQGSMKAYSYITKHWPHSTELQRFDLIHRAQDAALEAWKRRFADVWLKGTNG